MERNPLTENMCSCQEKLRVCVCVCVSEGGHRWVELYVTKNYTVMYMFWTIIRNVA